MQTWLFQHFVLGWTKLYISEVNQTLDTRICYRTVRNAFVRFEKTGFVDFPPRKAYKKQVGPELVHVLRAIIEAEPYLYLAEIADELANRTGVRLKVGHVHRVLLDAKISVKKMQRKHQSRKEEQRAIYWSWIYDNILDASWLVFADETSIDGRALRRRMGRATKGERVAIVELYHRGKRISVLATYTHSGNVRFRWVFGGYDAERFMDHMLELIAEVIKPFPGPDSVLVLDNCRIHHKYEAELDNAVSGAGGLLIFLAPYSPIDNPIEQEFNSFKACWRRDATLLSMVDPEAAVRMCFQSASVPGAAAKNYASCNYVFREVDKGPP
jgi:transposase